MHRRRLNSGAPILNHPCMIDNFLIADPPLQQVISHTYEAGVRGNQGTDVKNGLWNWSFGAFRISTVNDIINVASQAVPMFGFFQNAAKTRRQGIEAKINYRKDQWTAYANYTLIDATYQTAMTLQSANNPNADADGNVFVVPRKSHPWHSVTAVQGGSGVQLHRCIQDRCGPECDRKPVPHP